jgi:hypothetical protein
MRYAFAAPALLAVTAIAAPVSKPEEDVHVNDLNVDNVDVLPNLSITNIPKRSEELSIDGITPGIGVPTLLIPRDDGDADLGDLSLAGVNVIKRETEEEQQEDSNDGTLGLGFLGFTKREDILLGGSGDDGDLLDLIDLRKRGDGNGAKVDDSDSGPLDLGLRKREEKLANGDGGDDDDDILAELLGLLDKRGEAILTDGDQNGNGNNGGGLGVTINLRKRGDGEDEGDEDGEDDEDEDSGLLGLGFLGLRKREENLANGGGDDDDDDILAELLGLLGKRDEDLFGDSILGGILRKREENLANGGGDDDDDDDDDNDILAELLGLLDKRGEAILTDGDQNGNGNNGGGLDVTLNLRKREEDTSIGGVGGFDLATPVIDAVNV